MKHENAEFESMMTLLDAKPLARLIIRAIVICARNYFTGRDCPTRRSQADADLALFFETLRPFGLPSEDYRRITDFVINDVPVFGELEPAKQYAGTPVAVTTHGRGSRTPKRKK